MDWILAAICYVESKCVRTEAGDLDQKAKAHGAFQFKYATAKSMYRQILEKGGKVDGLSGQLHVVHLYDYDISYQLAKALFIQCKKKVKTILKAVDCYNKSQGWAVSHKMAGKSIYAMKIKALLNI
jgi:hypothetical protein